MCGKRRRWVEDWDPRYDGVEVRLGDDGVHVKIVGKSFGKTVPVESSKAQRISHWIFVGPAVRTRTRASRYLRRCFKAALVSIFERPAICCALRICCER